MSNPFQNRAASPGGPATDIVPVAPSDLADLPHGTAALYVETGGTLAILSEVGAQRTVAVADFSILPVRVRRVLQTGTTAGGIHAMVLA
jgi:hypothetical protein